MPSFAAPCSRASSTFTCNLHVSFTTNLKTPKADQASQVLFTFTYSCMKRVSRTSRLRSAAHQYQFRRSEPIRRRSKRCEFVSSKLQCQLLPTAHLSRSVTHFLNPFMTAASCVFRRKDALFVHGPLLICTEIQCIMWLYEHAICYT